MTFDPYHAWLGIPPDEQPPDHYRLLGLRQFETNVEAIANAMDQRMAHLRSLQSGAHADASQALLNEVAAAGRCLLQPDARAEYDEKLQGPAASAPAIPVIETGRPPASSGAGLDFKGSDVFASRPPKPLKPLKPLKTSRPSKSPLVAAAPWLGATVVVLLAAVFVFVNSGNREAPETAKTKPQRTGQPDRPTAPAAAAPTPDDSLASPPGLASPPPSALAPRPTPLTQPSPLELPPQTSQTLPTTGPFALELSPGDGVPLSNSASLIDLRRPFTCELWIQPQTTRPAEAPGQHALPQQQLLLGNCNLNALGGPSGWQIMILPGGSGRMRLAVSTDEGFFGEAPLTGTWQHVAVASDGRQITLFVDGALCARRPALPLAQSFRPTNVDLHLGAHPWLDPRQPAGFGGAIAAVRLSRGCLYRERFDPPERIDAQADATELSLDFTRPVAGLIADAASSARQGRLHGARWISIENERWAAAAAPPSPSSPNEPTEPNEPTASNEPTETDSPVEPTESVAESPGARRLPTPDPAELDAAVAQVRKTFVESADPGLDGMALAKRLEALSHGESESTTKLALLVAAQQLALESTGLAAALPIIDSIESQFEFDGNALRLAGLKQSLPRLRTPAQRAEFVDLALAIAETAAKAEQFEPALEAARMAQAQASRANDDALRRRAQQARLAVESSRKRQAAARQAKRRIDSAEAAGVAVPTAARGEWGRYLCFVRNDWASGLAQLAESDGPLAAVAAADLQCRDAAKRVAVADQWWSLALSAEEQREEGVQPMRDRAVHHYRLALPELEGVERIRANERMRANLSTNDPAALSEIFDQAMRKPLPTLPGTPADLACMLGGLSIDGAPRLLLTYQNGVRFSDASLREALRNANLPPGKIQLHLQGTLVLQKSANVLFRQRGGSLEGGQLRLLVDGKLLGTVGAGNSNTGVYRMRLASGQHAVQWQVEGGDLGSCQLLAIDADGEPLPLLHTREMATRIRRGLNLPTLRMVR